MLQQPEVPAVRMRRSFPLPAHGYARASVMMQQLDTMVSSGRSS